MYNTEDDSTTVQTRSPLSTTHTDIESWRDIQVETFIHEHSHGFQFRKRLKPFLLFNRVLERYTGDMLSGHFQVRMPSQNPTLAHATLGANAGV